VVLAGFLTVSITLLLFRRPFATPTFSYPGVFGPGHYLSNWLLDEEAGYAAFLQDRKEAIVKLGPEYQPFGHQMVTLWDFFIPTYRCPHRLERVGVIGDGGKWVCGIQRIAKQKKCVIYSFGVNGESSFEAALLKRLPHCEVWGYDFSVGGWGPEITEDPELKDRAHFQAWAISGTDAHGENDSTKSWTLDSLMKLNGHEFIDILKVDVEGAEFDTLTSFVNTHAHGDLPIGQLQLEIHAVGAWQDFGFFLNWWQALETAGLRPFSLEPNLIHVVNPGCRKPEVVEYSFINIRGNHALVSDAYD